MRHDGAVPPRPLLSLPIPRRLRTAMAEVDFDRAGLLDGLDGDARRVRIAVLESLATDGVDIDTMRGAIERDQLGLLLLERTLSPADGRSMTDICARTGLEREVVARWFQALGRPITVDPDDPIYTDEDLQIAERINAYRALGFADEDLMPVVRAIGRGVLSMADALGSLLGEAFLDAGDLEPQAALRYAVEARRIAAEDSLHLTHLVAVALADRIRSHAVAIGENTPGRLQGSQEVAVCFADLVGFTDLGENVSALELSAVAEQLAATATEVAARPVRLAKTIGDAVMLVSSTTTLLVQAAVDLAGRWARATDDRPDIRVGVAYGVGVPHAGDWFGPPVNLASRVTATARPGTVVVTAAVREQVVAEGHEDDFRWRVTSPRRFKGVRGTQRLFRVSAR